MKVSLNCAYQPFKKDTSTIKPAIINVQDICMAFNACFKSYEKAFVNQQKVQVIPMSLET
jgi:hypothetical protein